MDSSCFVMGESMELKQRMQYIRDVPSLQIKSKKYWDKRQMEWLMQTIIALQWDNKRLDQENEMLHQKWKQVNSMFGVEPEKTFTKKHDADLSSEHFNELLGTVMKTSGYSQKEIAERLGVHALTIQGWRKRGMPIRIKPYVVSVLKEICLSGKKPK